MSERDVSIVHHLNSTSSISTPSTQTEFKYSHATFVKEGPTVFKRSSFMMFLCRCILLIALFVLRQISSDIDARVDSDAFLESFSYVDEDGTRRTVGHWADGPGWRRGGRSDSGEGSGGMHGEVPSDIQVSDILVSQKDHIKRMTERWDAFYRKYAGHIPYAVALKPDIMPLEGWESDGKPPKITTLKETNRLCRIYMHLYIYSCLLPTIFSQ